LNTTSEKGGWQHFKKGKCNKCGKQGHKARDCNQNNSNNSSGKSENAKSKVKCDNCRGFGHITKVCPNKGESGIMFVGMTHHGHGNWEEYKLKTLAGTNPTVEYTEADKLAMEILNNVAENLKRKRDLNNAIHTFMWKPNHDKTAKTLIRLAHEDLNKMSWADMCETIDKEKDDPIYGNLNEEKTEDETATEISAEDKLEYGEIKENDPETLETVE
jgi:Zinc knuckle